MAKDTSAAVLSQEKKTELTPDEASVLLYFEVCLVDRRGTFSTQQMNEEDFAVAKRWRTEGFIDFGRVPYRSYRILRRASSGCGTHWVQFTDAAWVAVHRERRTRAEKHIDTI